MDPKDQLVKKNVCAAAVTTDDRHVSKNSRQRMLRKMGIGREESESQITTLGVES